MKKTKEELMGDFIFYPFIALFLLVLLLALVIIAPIVVVFVIMIILIVVAYAACFFVTESIMKIIDYLFIVHKENIKGRVIAMREITEQLLIVPINSNNEYNYMMPTQTIFITNYFLKIKKGVQWYTVKVPKYVFQKVKEQVKAGIKTIDLQCEKHGWNEFYELSKQS